MRSLHLQIFYTVPSAQRYWQFACFNSLNQRLINNPEQFQFNSRCWQILHPNYCRLLEHREIAQNLDHFYTISGVQISNI